MECGFPNLLPRKPRLLLEDRLKHHFSCEILPKSLGPSLCLSLWGLRALPTLSTNLLLQRIVCDFSLGAHTPDGLGVSQGRGIFSSASPTFHEAWTAWFTARGRVTHVLIGLTGSQQLSARLL